MRGKKAFTLVELLVVISIISLLLSIIIPVLAQGRKKAQRVLCKANLKQLALGAVLYSQDNQDKSMTNYVVNGKFWFQMIAPFLGDTGYKRAAETSSSSVANSQLRSAMKVLFCPTTKKIKEGPLYNESMREQFGTAKYAWAFYGSEGSYGVNTWITPETDNKDFIRTTYRDYTYNRFSEAKQAPVFADCTWVSGLPLDTDPAPMDVINGPPIGSSSYLMWRFTLNRHQFKINVAFADTHVNEVDLHRLWSLQWHKKFKTKDWKDFPYLKVYKPED
jgi:prepilin-type N-terminal cleavage/methylation domain-containing protein/prepilin-type processing-associated H-X9-DG protein